MSDQRQSLSVLYFDPEAEPVPDPISEPEPAPEPPKKRGRPVGAISKTKPKKKRNIPWFTIWRMFFWSAVSTVSVMSLYLGMRGWLGQSAGHLALAASAPVAAFLLDREWKKARK